MGKEDEIGTNKILQITYYNINDKYILWNSV